MKFPITILFGLLLAFQTFAQDQQKASDFTQGKFQLDRDAIIDPQNSLTPEQRELIQKEQRLFLENHHCIVSYAFYGIHNTQLEVQRTWKDSIPKESEQFHLLICIGSFLKNHNVDIQFKHPPLLDDINEVENILESARLNIQSERGMDAILNQSFSRINDDLTYFSTRPVREKDQSDQLIADKSKAFKNYITKVIKIALAVIIPLILLYIAWSYYQSASNKKPYYFPESKPLTRLGAPHGATSITQTKR